MKNLQKVLALVLVVAMALSFATMSTAAFTDAESITKTEAVDVLVALGVIDGYTDDSFKPEGTVTRAEMAKMIATILNEGEDVGTMYAGACTFADTASHWAAGYVAYCAQEGIINGRNASTFAPDDTVTGTEAAKMVLGALGHKADKAGLVGSAWASTTLSLAKKNNLIGALNNLTCKMDQPMTRENAAQLLLNGLKATVVEYKGGTNITIGDVVLNQGAEPEAELQDTAAAAADYAGRAANAGAGKWTLELAEKCFPKLKLDTTTGAKTDTFGRTCNTWNFDGNVVGVYSTAATLTYTTAVSLHQVYTDLGKVPADKLVGGISYFVDGAANVAKKNQVVANLASGSVDSFIGGQGVVTEVYFDDIEMKLNIVEINTYAGKVIGQVDAVKDANGDVVKEAYVVLGDTDGVTLAGTITGGALLADGNYAPAATVKSDAFTKADIGKTIVYYTKGNDAAQAKVQIQSVAKATEVSGTIKSLAADGVHTTDITLDTTNYKTNATFAGTLLGTLIDTPVKAYLDANGNILFQTGVASEDYALVLGEGKENTFADTVSAQLLFQDGTVKVVTLAASHDSTLRVIDGTTGKAVKDAANSEILNRDIVTYVVGADGTYTLTKVTNQGSVSYMYDHDNNAGTAAVAAVVTGNAIIDSPKYANANTTFTVGVKALGNATTYSSYTGVTAVPSFVAASNDIRYAMNATNTAVAAVFCEDATVLGAASDNAIMLYKTGQERKNTLSATNEYHSVAAVVNGEITTVKVAAAKYAVLPNGINLFSNGTTDTNGNYSAFGTAGLNKSDYSIFGAYADGVVTFDGTPTVVSADLPAFVWNDTTKKLEKTTISALYTLVGNFSVTRAATLAAPINAIYAVIN